MFFEGREERKSREGNERKMANPTVRENLKFYQMGSIREPVPPRFISNDGKIYSNVVPIINILFFARGNLLAETKQKKFPPDTFFALIPLFSSSPEGDF